MTDNYDRKDLSIEVTEIRHYEGSNPSLRAFVDLRFCGMVTIRDFRVLETGNGIIFRGPSTSFKKDGAVVKRTLVSMARADWERAQELVEQLITEGRIQIHG